MDITLITKIVAAGAMGVSIFCIIKVYDLLKNEQKEKIPRQNFIRTIYVSMGFAVLMTLLSLGIEIIRDSMDAELNQLETDLNNIASENYYSLNRNGNPKEINLTYKNQSYILSKAFPKDNFEKRELKFKKADNGEYLVVNLINDEDVIYGFIPPQDIKENAIAVFSDIINTPLNDEELLGLGLYYTPSETKKLIETKTIENKYLAIEYLLKFLNLGDVDNNSTKENKQNAIKILVQPQLMNLLSEKEYTSLIDILNSGVRKSPYAKYELAQVHRSRSGHFGDTAEKSKDRNTEKQQLKDYITYYDEHPWIQDIKAYPTEFKWYQESKTKLDIE
jgi:hypothetical protein